MTVGGTGKVIDRPWHGYIDTLQTRDHLDSNEPVALLAQVLQALPDGFTVVLDVKDDQPLQVLDQVHGILSQFAHKNLDIYLGVWREDFAIHARKTFADSPHIRVTLITELCTQDQLNSSLYDAFNLDVTQIHADIVQGAAELGKNVLLWTCNSESDIAKAKALKVQGILTDDPTSV